jgi:hypothetical protein
VVEEDPFASPLTPGKPGRPSKQEQHEAAVLELIEALDVAGVPDDTGYRAVRDWDAARRPGQSVTEKAARDAVSARRGRHANLGTAASAADPKYSST